MNALKNGRMVILGMLCMFLAACTQTTTSSYNGKIGKSTPLTEKQRQAKIAAARKRASLARKKAREEFKAKRENRRAERRTALLERRKQGGTLKTRSVKRKTKGRLSKRRLAKTNKNLRRKTASLKKRRIKNRQYAFVGGKSRGMTLNAPWRCVPPRLKKVLGQVSRKFGRVIINSTRRSKRHNRLVGGKRRSYHLRCQAVDFRVRGKTRGLTRWLARHPLVGGWKRYRSGYYHIDTGPKRTW